MKFYRKLNKIHAMSFDLDDTLYENQSVIRTTLLETLHFMQAWHPRLAEVSWQDYQYHQAQLLQKDPALVHDVSLCRQLTLQQLLHCRGLSTTESQVGTDAIMSVFYHWRSAVTITDGTHHLLRTLAECLPLIAITNGNADPKRMGIDHYFQFVLCAGPDGRAKPFADLFQKAERRLAIEANHILHIGDDLRTDVQGALLQGYQSCWLNPSNNLRNLKAARLLPHIEITSLASLPLLI